MVLRITFLISFLFLAANAYGQFWKKKKEQTTAVQQQPTSLNPSSAPAKSYAPKSSTKKAKGPTYGLEQEFYDRMEALAKERKKMEKIMSKPQYSDPMYFGHKRPPKKRKPSKMKYCKECGIRH